MAKITLDSKTFQALASSTRLTVLRALDERRKTLTELARDLDLNKATVHEHLQLLASAGLVKKRDDEGRKWIYYELTWTGEKLLHPQETTTFNVLLGLAVAAAGGGVAILGRALGMWMNERQVGAPEGLGDGVTTSLYANDAGTETGTETGTGSPGTETGPPQASGVGAEDSMRAEFSEGAHGDGGVDLDTSNFFDDGGWMGLALMLAAIAFTVLAISLRKHVRPGRFRAEMAAQAEADTAQEGKAEGAAGPQEPGPGAGDAPGGASESQDTPR